MCLESSWFAKAREAHEAGMDNVYDYGIMALRQRQIEFYEEGSDRLEPYSSKYLPNPFRFQYDLSVFCWLNYYRLLENEIKILRQMHNRNPDKGFDFKADQLSITRTLYDIKREDFLFAAAELRWPTRIVDGSCYGLLIRDPWAEMRFKALSDQHIKNTIAFGGGGQGKTLTWLAFCLIMFDYFIFTQKGARCMISTVNKDKLDSVGWAYLCNLNSSTEANISLTAGRAKISGDHTLTRPSNKDKGGIFKGILIGDRMNDQVIIDKLTGSHGHPFLAYILDEMQSTPDAPVRAAPNYTMHARDWRILGSGNYGENSDTLAENIKPDLGWDKVDENTGHWVSTMKNSFKAIVLHFNNNNSPGMDEELHKRFPHLPSQKNLDQQYPDKTKRNLNNDAYRRFWVGFRVEDSDEATVVSSKIVRENMADAPLNLSLVMHNFFTFDSAPAEIDRNACVTFREGICAQTNNRVFGPVLVNLLDKATESLKYYEESSEQLLEIARKNNIMPGSGTVDWTGRPAQAERLLAKGFKVHRMVYNKAVPDGKRRDIHTKRIEKAIKLNIQLDFKNDIAPSEICAHHVAENVISLGAWALREYIKAGRVRGLNASIIAHIIGHRDLEEELYHRKFKYKVSAIYGKRFHLESKDDFKELYGFSPDILDCLFEAAWYMLTVRRLPLTHAGVDDMVEQSKEDYIPDEEEHLAVWAMDGLSKL